MPYWAPLKVDNLGVNVTDLKPWEPSAPPLAISDIVQPLL